MKKVIGVILLSCVCILLGLSVKWSVVENISLVSNGQNPALYPNML